MTDQVSHPYNTKGKIIVLFILIFKFFDNWKAKDSFVIEEASLKFEEHWFSDEGVGLCKQVATKDVHLSHARG
jgi:hypothetical protein